MKGRWSRRAAVGSRVLAAGAGGYALSAAVAVWLGLVLPGPRSEAVTTGILVSFLVMTGAVLWAFGARSTLRAWLGLLLPTLGLGAWALILHARNAG
ncbi:DUF3649 domain-containing protein [Azospirillum sp. ST 5-10]|uniref:DUF3649 domain-containing protein n=1 Tax=unclassified Azospirillum TaxID=2630922 RepID=UPI003F4A6575